MIDIIGMKEFASTADASTASRCFKRAGTLQRVGNKYVWHYKNHRLVVDPPDALGKYRAWCFTGEKVVETLDCENVWNAMAEIERMVDDEKALMALGVVKMSRKRSLVFGVGVNDWGGNVKVDGKPIKEYRLWQDMLQRCFSEKYKQKKQTYKDVTCSKEWLSMTTFIEDVSQMRGFGLEGWALDKDILQKGNKLYGKDTCCFVPAEVNSLLIKSDNSRGEFPVGVCFHKASIKFMAYIKINGKAKHLGYFTTPEEAFQVYKLAKEAQIKVVAEKWKHLLDERVYLALMTYEVSIDD